MPGKADFVNLLQPIVVALMAISRFVNRSCDALFTATTTGNGARIGKEDGLGAQAGNILGYWARGRKPIVQSLLLWLSPALVLALLEPFDSGVLPLPLRFAYWALLMVSFSLVLPPCIGLAERLYRAHTRHAPTVLAIACAIAAVPVTLVVQILDWLLALAAVPVFGQPVPH